MKRGLGKIFLTFLQARTMSFLLLNFDQEYKFNNKNLVQVVNDKGSKGTHGCSSFMYFHYSRKERDFMTIPPLLSPFSPAKSSALIQSFSCG